MSQELPPQTGHRTTPSVPIFYPDWLVLTELKRDIAFALQRYARGRLLDVGCGARPYEALAVGIDSYLGLDLAANPLADIHGTADAIPLPDDSVDTVLCSQLLEHVENPAQVIAECARVLRAGGALILGVPQYWPLHEEPRDFFRYTEFGVKALLGNAGLEIVAHRREGCGVAVAGQALNNAILCAGDTLAFKDRFWFKAMKAPFYLAINVATVALRPILRTQRDVLNHLFVALKPANAGVAKRLSVT